MLIDLLIAAALAGAALSVIASARCIRLWPLSVLGELVAPATLAAATLFALALWRANAVAALAAAGVFAGAVAVSLRASARALNPDGAAGGIGVAHVNLLDSLEAARRFADWAKTNGADIVALTEPPPGAMQALAPLFPDLPHALQSEDEGRRRVVLFSRFALSRLPSPHVNVLVAEAATPAGALRIVTAHPTIPTSPGAERRRDDVIEKAIAAVAADRSALLVGDFNVTPTGPAFGDLFSAAPLRRAGAGVIAPTWMAPLFGLGLTLDHIFVSTSGAVGAYSVGPLIGSDHRPIFARIRFAQMP